MAFKGNIPIDMIIITIVMVFLISFVVILADKLNTDVISNIGTKLNTTGMSDTDDTLQLFDTGIPFLFFGFILAMILLAWYLRSTPILAIILIIIIAIVVIIGASISNTFHDVARSDTFAATANDYPYTVYINENLPLFLGVMGFIVIIFMFAKPKGVSI